MIAGFPIDYILDNGMKVDLHPFVLWLIFMLIALLMGILDVETGVVFAVIMTIMFAIPWAIVYLLDN